MTNAEIAAALEELGTLYERDGADRYRVRAYRSAARAIRDYPDSVAELSASGQVQQIPGVGKTLAEKIAALLETGEIPAALKLRGKLPAAAAELDSFLAENPAEGLIELADIRGDLHAHTTLSDGRNTLEEMATAGRDRGYSYMAITDHSASHGFGDNVQPERLEQRIEEVAAWNEGTDRRFRLLVGSEINIGLDGSTRLSRRPASPSSTGSSPASTPPSTISEKDMTARVVAAIEDPNVDCIGHLTGRLIGRREPYAIDVEAVAEAAARTGTMIEINGNPNRRDLSERHARLAADAGRSASSSTPTPTASTPSTTWPTRRHRPPRLADQGRSRQHPQLGGVQGSDQGLIAQPVAAQARGADQLDRLRAELGTTKKLTPSRCSIASTAASRVCQASETIRA